MENSNPANRAGNVNYHVITSYRIAEDALDEERREIAFITLRP
jgi:hypothetical protein